MKAPRSLPAWFAAFAALLFCAPVLRAGVNRWTTNGPLTGQINGLSSDPGNSARLFAGTTSGGVFRSLDSGATWQAVNDGFDSGQFPVGFVFTTAVDPTRPSIVYAGTDTGGIFRSLDGGDHWELTSDGLTYYGGIVIGLAIDPTAPDTIYAGTFDGVFKSVNGGCSWQASNDGLPVVNDIFYLSSFTMDPTNPAVLYAGSDFVGAYKSIDAGSSWTPISVGLPYASVASIAVDPTQPSRVFAANNYFVPEIGTSGGTILRSEDGGASWSPSNLGLPDIQFRVVLIDSDSTATVWAASVGAGLFRSDDGGDHWATANDGLDDLSVIALLRLPTEILAGASTLGVFRRPLSGGAWTPSNVGLHGSSTNAIATVATNPDAALVAGTSYLGGMGATDDAGGSWHSAGAGLPSGVIGLGVAVDPTDALVAYASVYFPGYFGPTTFKTTDGGSLWVPSENGDEGDPIAQFSIDPTNPSHVLAGGGVNLYFSLDAGGTWTPATPTLVGVSSIVRDSRSVQRVLAVSDGSLVESTDGGQSFAPLGSGLEGVFLVSLEQDAAALDTFYGGAQGGLFRSTDNGATWLPLGNLGSLGIFSIVVDPVVSGRMFVGTAPYTDNTPQYILGGGIFQSLDGGQTWSPFDHGLENPAVDAIYALRLDGAGRLLAGTTGGVFVYTFSDSPAPEPQGVNARSGPAIGGTAVTVVGVSFVTGARVYFGGVEASDVSVIDQGRISATTPPGLPGAVEVKVANPDTQYEILARAYAYDYADVPAGDTFYASVEHLTLAGVTAGCGGGRFCPTDPVTRAQMAVLMERTLHGPDYAYPKPGDTILDVDPCAPDAKFIYELTAEAITAGCGPEAFCPDSPLTRAQVAVWLLKGRHGADYVPPPATGSVFTDVAPGDFAADWIEELAAEGLTAGCRPGAYCPDADVSRGEAAAFLDLAFLEP